MVKLEKVFILRCLRELTLDDSCLELEQKFLRELDWVWIIKTCNSQGILGFIAYVLQRDKLFQYLDQKVQEILKIYKEKYKQNFELKQKYFQEVSNLFKRELIPVIPLKGVALSYLLYEAIPFRQMCDLDILVKAHDVQKACELLNKNGFVHKKSGIKYRWHDEILFKLPPLQKVSSLLGRVDLMNDEMTIDLHWNPRYILASNFVEVDWEKFWGKATNLSQCNSYVYTLDKDDQILFLLLHLAEFYRPSLIQILDTALFIKKYKISIKDVLSSTISSFPDSSKLHIETFINAVQDFCIINSNCLHFSSRTLEIFERCFFNKAAINRNYVNVICSYFQFIESPKERLMFILGCFLPDREYYKSDSIITSYLKHWKGLILDLGQSMTLGNKSFSIK